MHQNFDFLLGKIWFLYRKILLPVTEYKLPVCKILHISLIFEFPVKSNITSCHKTCLPVSKLENFYLSVFWNPNYGSAEIFLHNFRPMVDVHV